MKVIVTVNNSIDSAGVIEASLHTETGFKMLFMLVKDHSGGRYYTRTHEQLGSFDLFRLFSEALSFTAKLIMEDNLQPGKHTIELQEESILYSGFEPEDIDDLESANTLSKSAGNYPAASR